MKAFNAFCFFNGGFNAGASIPHKHMQVIPYQSINKAVLPIEEVAMKYCQEEHINKGTYFFLP